MNPWWKRPAAEEKETTTKTKRRVRRDDEAPAEALEPGRTPSEAESAPASAPGRGREPRGRRRASEDRIADAPADAPARRARQREPEPEEAVVTSTDVLGTAFYDAEELDSFAPGDEEEEVAVETPARGRRRRRRRRPRSREGGAGQRAEGARGARRYALFAQVEAGGTAELPLETLLEVLGDRPMAARRAYGHFTEHDPLAQALNEADLELVDVSELAATAGAGGLSQPLALRAAAVMLAVDVLDLCYSQPEVETVFLVSADESLVPLVAKLRERGRQVIVFGPSNAPRALVESCDEFESFEDLRARVAASTEAADTSERRAHRDAPREGQEPRAPREPRRQRERHRERDADLLSADDREPETPRPARRPPAEVPPEVLRWISEAIEELMEEQRGVIWASLVKQSFQRRHTAFHESEYGYDSFVALLEAAERQGVVRLHLDPRSGTYAVIGFVPYGGVAGGPEPESDEP